MPRQNPGALRAERERIERERRSTPPAQRARSKRRQHFRGDDEYTPTRRDRRLALAAAAG